MEQLPKKWCIKAENNKEAKVIIKYINPLSLEHGYLWNSFVRTHYASINNGKFVNGYYSPHHTYIKLTFEQFERLVLKTKNQDPTYEIY